MSKIKYKRDKKYWSSSANQHLKRPAEHVTEEAISGTDHSPGMAISSSGSPDSSDREELLKTINQPLFAEFFCKRRKIESSDTQSTSSSCGSAAQDSSGENSPEENSPRDHSSEDRGQKADTYNSNRSDTEESINKKSQHKRYEFKTILDGLSKQKFSKGTSISSLSSHDSSTGNKNVKMQCNKSSSDNEQKNLTKEKGKSTLPHFKKFLPNNTKGLDLLSPNSSVWHYYKNNVISPSTSLDGFKRDNSTVSDCLTSNASIKSLEEMQQENHTEDNSLSRSNGSSSSRESSPSSNHQDCLHDGSSSSTDSECKKHQNKSCNNSAKINTIYTPSMTGKTRHGTGGYANMTPYLYLNAPKGYVRYTPYHAHNWNSPATGMTYPNFHKGLLPDNIYTHNHQESFRSQTHTSGTWYGRNTKEQEMLQLSQTNIPKDSGKVLDALPHFHTLQNNQNKIRSNDSTVEDHSAGMNNFLQAPILDNKMNGYYEEQKTKPIENSDQKAKQVILPLENQDTVQKNEQIMSETSNMESLVWSDEIRNILEDKASSAMHYPNVWHQQHVPGMMYQNLQTGILQDGMDACIQQESLRFQSPTSETAWYSHDNFDTLQNNHNNITSTENNVQDNTEGMSHFPQASILDNKMKKYHLDQKLMSMENYEQEAEEVILDLEDQDTVQKNQQIISETSNMEPLVWSDEISNIMGDTTSSVMQYVNVWHQQHLSTFQNNSQMNITSPQKYQDLYQNNSQQNFEASDTLPQKINSPEQHITTNSQRKSRRKEPKSQMAFIALAIMSHPDCKMTLSEIYQHIEKNHPRYLRRPDWRNGVRHTLSHNVCFIKIEKALHRPRKGHYWSIHPACINAFSEEKFCLRHSKRLVMTFNNPCISSGEPQQDVLTDLNETNNE